MTDSEGLKFNLNPLYAKGVKIAVWCPVKDAAIQFVRAVKAEHIRHFRHWSTLWGESDENWSRYKTATCYCPNLNGFNDTDYFQFGSKSWFEDNDYTIIHVNELLECTDLGEFDPVDTNALAFFL